MKLRELLELLDDCPLSPEAEIRVMSSDGIQYEINECTDGQDMEEYPHVLIWVTLT